MQGDIRGRGRGNGMLGKGRGDREDGEEGGRGREGTYVFRVSIVEHPLNNSC